MSKLSEAKAFVLSLGMLAFLWILAPAQAGEGGISAATQISINGYEGTLEPVEVGVALDTARALGIGDPPFLKEDLNAASAGIVSCLAGTIQKEERVVHFLRLQFVSEAAALSALNQMRKATRKESPLSVEDPSNCRNPHFGLYFDGKQWSGYRRVEGSLVLLKGAISQEDFFRLMEKAL